MKNILYLVFFLCSISFIIFGISIVINSKLQDKFFKRSKIKNVKGYIKHISITSIAMGIFLLIWLATLINNKQFSNNFYYVFIFLIFINSIYTTIRFGSRNKTSD
jgi:hypothetical protein